MFCSKCGNQVADDAAFCDKCGARLNAQPHQPPRAPAHPQGAQYQYQPPQRQSYGSAPQAPYGLAPIGMKWFKFLIYFLLFATAIINAFNGISIINGGHYTVDGVNVSEAVYAEYSALQMIDVLYGLALIATGGFQIYIRFQLAAFKKNAPILFMYLYIVLAVIMAVYCFAVMGVVPYTVVSHSVLMGQAIGGFVGAGVMFWLNKIYFDKRSHLFVKW